jgi:hypothetical protein
VDAPLRLLLAYRDPLRRACTACAVAVPLAFAAGALVVDGWAAQRFLLLYAAPFVVALFLWARIRLGRMEADRPGALAVDAVAVALCAVRFAGPYVPFSGHMLFFAYAGLTTPSASFRLLVLLLAAETTWFKLVLWRDPRSWALGIAAGAALAAVRIFIHRDSPDPAIP